MQRADLLGLVVLPLGACGLFLWLWSGGGFGPPARPVLAALGLVLLIALVAWRVVARPRGWVLGTAAWPGRWQYTWRHSLWAVGRGALPAASACLWFALAGVPAVEPVTRLDLDVVLVLDDSESMALPDGLETRAEHARRLALSFTQPPAAYHLGIVGFAGSAFLLAPLSDDLEALTGLLHADRQPGLRTGTAIGDALMLALAHLRHSSASRKAIVLLSDGGHNVGQATPSEAAAAARSLGIPVHTVLVGTPVPLMGAEDANPQPLVLQSVSGATGGSYLPAVAYRAPDDLQDFTAGRLLTLTQRAARRAPALLWWCLGCLVLAAWQAWGGLRSRSVDEP